MSLRYITKQSHTGMDVAVLGMALKGPCKHQCPIVLLIIIGILRVGPSTIINSWHILRTGLQCKILENLFSNARTSMWS